MDLTYSPAMCEGLPKSTLNCLFGYLSQKVVRSPACKTAWNCAERWFWRRRSWVNLRSTLHVIPFLVWSDTECKVYSGIRIHIFWFDFVAVDSLLLFVRFFSSLYLVRHYFSVKSCVKIISFVIINFHFEFWVSLLLNLRADHRIYTSIIFIYFLYKRTQKRFKIIIVA